jgi:hypothetical protein
VKAPAIDGGGIRGLIPALVLAEIERRTGRRMATMVDRSRRRTGTRRALRREAERLIAARGADIDRACAVPAA